MLPVAWPRPPGRAGLGGRLARPGRPFPGPPPAPPPPRGGGGGGGGGARGGGRREGRRRGARGGGRGGEVILAGEVWGARAGVAPASMAELESVQDLGAWRRAEYGEEILRVLRAARA